MAFIAGHRCVRSAENESRVRMMRDGVGGRLELGLCVAAIAVIFIWQPGELGIVNIPMAVDAGKRLNFVDNSGRIGFMTFNALKLCMTVLERKPGGFMFHYIKCSRLEALNAVTLITCSAAGTGGKLTAMRIFFVAIGTLSKCYG
jgi:hypothetical protein